MVRGRVQGVGFRWWARERARTRGLSGSVFNRRDGAVEVLAEGPRPALESLLADLGAGPAGAAVSGVEAQWLPAAGGRPDFEILPSR